MGTLLVRLVDDPGGAGWHEAAWWLAAIVMARAAAAYLVDTVVRSGRGRGRPSPCAASSLEGALAMDAQSLSRRRTGELTVLATRGLAAIEPYLTRYVPTLVLAAVLPVASVVAIFWLDWLSGLVVVLTLPLVPVFAVLIGFTTQDRADRQWKQLSALSGHFLDVVRGLPTLVAHRRAEAQGALDPPDHRPLPSGHGRHPQGRLRLLRRPGADRHHLGGAGRRGASGCGCVRAAWTSGPRWWCCCSPRRRTGRCAAWVRSSTPPRRAPPPSSRPLPH